MARVLVVQHTPSPNVQTMLEAVLRGTRHPELPSGVSVDVVAALSSGAADVLAADAVIIGGPANIGYMAGALKHWFDSIYYPCLEVSVGKPYGVFIHGNNDTTGALRAIHTIAGGLRWRQVAPDVDITGEVGKDAVAACEEASEPWSPLPRPDDREVQYMTSSTVAGQRPNILLIVTDEERYALPEPDGFSLPARDRIRARGTSFDNYYVASAQCSSSRSVIYTGRHMPITEIFDNDNMPYIRPLDPGLGTLGTMLRQAGYYCTYQGKWHLSRAYRQPGDTRSTVDALEPYGFSEFNDWGDLDGGAWAGLRVDPVIAGQAAGWLRNRAGSVVTEQPWFMAVNFVNPHDIMSYDYGGRRVVQPPPNLAEAMVVRPPADIPIYQRQWDFGLASTVDDDLSGAAPAVREYAAAMATMFGPVPDHEAWHRGMNFYLNCTRDVDRSIGTVLDALTAAGQDDRTVVIFTSDHGEMAGGHGLRQKGNLAYDENFHVPLVIQHPDLVGGRTTDALGSAVDLAPTLLDIAGVDPATVAERHPGLHGTSLLPTLNGDTVRQGVLTAVEIVTTLDNDYWRDLGAPDGPARVQSGELRPDWSRRGFLRGYTDQRYTFARYFSPLSPNRPRTPDQLFADNDVVLYDRSTDPGETINLAPDPAHATTVATLLDRLESMIDAEIGADTHSWVAERPRLLGYPTWHGDHPAASAG